MGSSPFGCTICAETLCALFIIRDLNGRKRQQSIRIVAPPRRDSAGNGKECECVCHPVQCVCKVTSQAEQVPSAAPFAQRLFARYLLYRLFYVVSARQNVQFKIPRFFVVYYQLILRFSIKISMAPKFGKQDAHSRISYEVLQPPCLIRFVDA